MIPGTWVRFRYENGRWDDPRWLSIRRDWLLDLRSKLKDAWRARYGEKVPLGATPKAWVLSELDKMGVRLHGEDAIHLPYALYLEIQAASDGDGKTGPRGKWERFDGILPAPKRRPDEGLSRYRMFRDRNR